MSILKADVASTVWLDTNSASRIPTKGRWAGTGIGRWEVDPQLDISTRLPLTKRSINSKVAGDVGWNPASNSEGEEGFVVKEVQGRRGPLNPVTVDAHSLTGVEKCYPPFWGGHYPPTRSCFDFVRTLDS